MGTRSRLSPARQRKAGQLAFIPTRAEEKRAAKEARERADRGVQCWQCRLYRAADFVSEHPETGMMVCASCEPSHVRFYDRYLERRMARDGEETGCTQDEYRRSD